MAINLVKGQTIDLRKNDRGETFDLSSVTMGLGWDVRQQKTGFLSGLFGSQPKQEEYDLDAIAFLLDADGKVANLGTRRTTANGMQMGYQGADIIFFNNLKHPSGQIWLTGDNRTGAGDGDDEQIIVKLDSLDEKYQRILFLVTIYEGRKNGQHFGMVENAFIRAVDARGKEIVKFSLSGDATYNGKCSVVFAEAYRRDGSWKFRAIGDAKETDAFLDILASYR